MNDKMKKMLDDCFNARIRELTVIKSITKEKETSEIDKEIEVIESFKSLQKNDLLFKL